MLLNNRQGPELQADFNDLDNCSDKARPVVYSAYQYA